MKLTIIAAVITVILVSGCVSSPGSYDAAPQGTGTAEFMGFLTVPVTLEGGEGTLRIGDREYPISGGTVTADGSKYDISNFTLEGIQFTVDEKTDKKTVFRALVYTNDDIVEVKTGPQYSGVVPYGSFYRFYFAIEMSEEAGQRFADLTMNIPTTFEALTEDMDTYLDSEMLLYLDGEEITSLRISGELAGEAVTTPSIMGTENTEREAFWEMQRLQQALS